ncbi:MBL fold metallo-hydrolase [Amycolatopsis orientalis]|uniref:MBL fold metallo-hydrolase n=1 Tax=Amycolatopsis orientalis TaxID=31958 RepID=UPI0003A3AC84|nr:MBL fold metallo-hydrolase [Amycolatopsis orientalis]
MCELETSDVERGRPPAVQRRRLLQGAGGALAAAGLLGTGFAAPASAAPSRPANGAAAELILLGTQAGPPVEPDRMGISTALVVDGATYLIDCGRGATTQYLRAGLRFDDLKAVFLTHLHADHVADYYNIFLMAGGLPNSRDDVITTPVQVYGPGPAGALPAKFGGGQAPTVNPGNPTPGTYELTQSCHDAYAYSTNVFLRDSGIADIRTLVDVREIRLPDVGADPLGQRAPAMNPFPVMEDDRVRVSAVLVPHGPVFPSFAFRFETAYGSVTFSGDTTYTSNLETLARGSDLLVHEAVNVQGATLSPAFRSHLLQSHVEVQNVGAIAQRSDVPRLILSHIGDQAVRPINTARWRRWAQQGYDGRVHIGNDLDRIPLT